MASELPSLQLAWVEACEEFRKATDIDISLAAKDNPNYSQSIEDSFKAAREKIKDEESRKTISKVKSGIGKTMMVIEKIGTVAAQDASVVFGSPATITMMGISFFIKAGFEYKNMAESMDNLFNNISTTMERFQIYREYESIMHPLMIHMAHRVLVAVVKICGLCIQQIKANKFKRIMKVAFFQDDGGIKSQLAVLAALESEELRTNAALNNVAAETTKRNTSDIKESVTQLNKSSSEDKVLDYLKDKLGADTMSSKDAYQLWRDKYESGNCSWLEEDIQYRLWSDIADQGSLLILKGDEGCGKSYTVTNIIRDLMKRYPQNQHDVKRNSIAYHYITRSTKDNQASKSEPSIKHALREWAWQILKNDEFYRKDLHSMFKQNTDMGDLSDMWQKLFINHLKKEATYFLVLDGIQDLEEKDIDSVITLIQSLPKTGTSSGRLKIVITARPHFVQKLHSRVSMDIIIIDLREKSQDDMKTYIQNKADKLAIFGKVTPEIRELKEQVCSGLLEAVKGNFLLADMKLREIGGKYDIEEVKQIVENAKEGSDLNDTMLEDLRKCNKTLNSREMLNLNTLLLWAIYGAWYFDLNELESILFIQQKRSSLQPVYNQIRDKFSAFFDIMSDVKEDDFYLTVKYDSMVEYFESTAQKRDLLDTTASQRLTDKEIRVAKSFIQRLCEPELYEKLGFGEFFEDKLSRSDIGVLVDCENAQATLALNCLQFMTGEFSKEADGLLLYAQNHLVTHLKQLDLDRVDPRLKAELGPRLVKLFTDRASIIKANDNDLKNWAYSDVTTQEVIRLLQSSAVMRKIAISDVDQEWVSSVLNHAVPEVALLQEALNVTASEWLAEEDSSTVMFRFNWIYGYYNKIQNEKHPDTVRLQEKPSPESVSVEDIQAIVEMIKPLEISSPFQLRNLGITYRETRHPEEAIIQFKKALEIDPDNLHAHASMAIAYVQEVTDGPKPQWNLALQHQDFVIERLRAGMRTFSDVAPDESLKVFLEDKALWQRKAGRYDESCNTYNELLQKYPEDDIFRLDLVTTLCEAKYFSDIVELLQQLSQEVDPKDQKNCLVRFFHAHFNNPDYHSTIVQAFKQNDSIPEIKNHYRQALADKEGQTEITSLEVYYLTSFYFAAMLHSHGEGSEDKQEAVQLWEHIIEKALPFRKSDGLFWPRRFSAKWLAWIYIAEAIEAGRDSVLANELIAKVQSFAVVHDDVSTEDWQAGLSQYEVRNLLGGYFSESGQFDKAKEILRPGVEVGLKHLTDDDPDNDHIGYKKLAESFKNFGDEANALAAWCLIQPTGGIEYLHTSSSSTVESEEVKKLSQANKTPLTPKLTSNVEDAPNNIESQDDRPLPRPILHRANTSNLSRRITGPLAHSCDGCGIHVWSYADNIYVCRQCIDLQLDESCYEKLQRGELGRNVCHPSHKFLHVPEWSFESYERAQNGKVLVGEEILHVDEWLEGIKKEWGFETAPTDISTA